MKNLSIDENGFYFIYENEIYSFIVIFIIQLIVIVIEMLTPESSSELKQIPYFIMVGVFNFDNILFKFDGFKNVPI